MRLSLLLVLAVSSAALAAPKKNTIPTEAAQKASLALVADVYKPDIAKAKLSAQKIELAKKLLAEGIATKGDNTGRYVLMKLARDLASQQGDLKTAFDAIEKMHDEFSLDLLEFKGDIVATNTKNIRAAKDHWAANLELMVPLIEEFVDADRYDEAKSLCAQTLTLARDAKNSDLIKSLLAKGKEIDDIAVKYNKVKEAMAALETKPTDPANNLIVGKFLCLVKGDWERGIAMLALGDDPTFKSAALLELADKPEALKLGDAWWKIAETLVGPQKLHAQVYAGKWYQDALPGMSGLPRTRVERLLAQIEAASTGSKSVKTAQKPMRVLDRRMHTWTGNKDAFARFADPLTMVVGRTAGADKYFAACAGMQIEGASILVIETAITNIPLRSDSVPFVGFTIDYSVTKGQPRAVGLSFSLHDDKRAYGAATWSKEKVDTYIDIGRRPKYEIDVRKLAPPDWDGKIWLTTWCQNAGTGEMSVTAKVVGNK